MKVTLIGMGCGSETLQTVEALAALRQAEVLIGSERLLDGVRRQYEAGSRINSRDKAFPGEASFHVAASAEAVYEMIRKEAGRNTCVLYSGDTGFYSGVRTLLPLLERDGIEAKVIPGISSLQLFSARIGSPWQDWNLFSAHGIHCNAVNAVMQGKPAFFLTGGRLGPAELCGQLVRAGLGSLAVAIGEALSYETERIYRCTATEAAGMEFAPLSVMLAEPAPVYGMQDDAQKRGKPAQTGLGAGRFGEAMAEGFGREEGSGCIGEAVAFSCGIRTIPDSQFVRGSVPMTKRDVRAAILGRLRICPGDVIWDVGAGTGSVSVEMALAARFGQVFAVECNEEACRLIETNRHKFGAWNLSLIAGKAPERLRELPLPDAVFIGGSKGRMAEIVAMIHRKNENARICIAAIALETLQAAVSALEAWGWAADVAQISVSQAKKAGSLHLMMANNPVFLITNGD